MEKENGEVQLNKFNIGSYSPMKSSLVQFFWYLINITFFRTYFFPVYSWKRFLLRVFGSKIGKGVVIKPGVSIKYPWLLSIGDYSWIGEQVWIDNLVHIDIGKNVCVSQGALLLTGNHDYKKKSFDLITGQIVLENGVWIGAKSVVCPGVICSSHSVLSVGSVASSNLEEYSIYKGNPAKKIRERVLEID